MSPLLLPTLGPGAGGSARGFVIPFQTPLSLNCGLRNKTKNFDNS